MHPLHIVQSRFYFRENRMHIEYHVCVLRVAYIWNDSAISVIKIRYLSLKRSCLVNEIIQDVPMVRDIPCNSINHSIPPGEAERPGERERKRDSRVQTQRVDAQRSAAFRCAINNRDVSSHSSAVTRSTFWRDTAASCRVTRITAVTLRAPSISLFLSSLTCFLSLSLSLSATACTDQPTDHHCSMPSYVVKPCQLNYRQTSHAGRLSLSRAAVPIRVMLKSRAVESAIDTAFREVPESTDPSKAPRMRTRPSLSPRNVKTLKRNRSAWRPTKFKR